MTRLLATLPLLAGCGLTFGVDAVERVTDVEADPGDAVALVIRDLGVDDDVVVCGGAEVVAAHIATTEWGDGGDGASAVQAELVRTGDDLELRLGGGAETVTLKGVTVDMPSSLGADVSVTEGGLEICDLEAEVFAEAESVTLREIAAPATTQATSTHVDNTVPLDLVASGNVDGTLGADGTVTASGDVILTLTEPAVDALDIFSEATEDGSHVSLWLPPGGAWTISIQSDYGIGLVEVGGARYDSTAEDAPSLADGVTLEIDGGGPLIQVTAGAANIFVRESTQ